jgi:hypothetical protein
VAQTMYAHVNICKNVNIKERKKKRKSSGDSMKLLLWFCKRSGGENEKITCAKRGSGMHDLKKIKLLLGNLCLSFIL